MTDATSPAAPQAPAPPQAPAAPAAGTAAEDEVKEGRIGTILMTVAIAGIAVLALDVALKGRLLAPLFALLPAPKTPAAAEEPGDGGVPPGSPG